MTNSQVVTVTLTAQTVGGATLTIPDFANVSDEFTFKTKAQTLSNKTFIAPALGVATGTSFTATGLIKSSSPSAGIGYATGAGSTVTQATSKSTGVTINAICGAITMNGAALANGVNAGFTVTNSSVAAADVVVVNIKSGSTASAYNLTVDAVAAGSFACGGH